MAWIAAARIGLTLLAALVAASVLLASATAPALSASDRACRQLEFELASASGSTRSNALTRKYDAAIARQQEQLEIAGQRARRSGCSASLLGRGGGQCGAFNAKVRSMERNLEQLRKTRAELSGHGSVRSRGKVLAALAAQGCRGGDVGAPGRKVDRVSPGRNTDAATSSPSSGGYSVVGVPNGRYRTLCVRSCDGYFFPMSNASRPADFGRDRQNCETSCPGADVQVYYHRTQGEDSANMLSTASGAPYASLPTAYLYKRPDAPAPSACSCSRPGNFQDVSSNPAGAPKTNGSFVVTGPQRAPAAPSSSTGTPAEADPPGARGKRIRVVGPAFLPGPEAEANPRAPAPTQVR